ncbi:cytochrome C oxidase subunit IV family protein [Thiohalomonas denitrificans]|uniref:Caa(3)-type oxidase, subunit IV n=1 Tax=Thiohalomonas denitrificans TaxID=415747 RepID=A0A1G5Q9B8_9GAMM|nr:cytochrome C oxidase subunit IV family protein [Thiohalomonas denitrificans]SCZ58166.1 caa(3)-type oxidase, subunit IV [Thiohalomonas denitrificans]
MKSESTTVRAFTVIWVLLLVLTLMTFAIGEMQLAGPAAVSFVLAMTLLKSQLVASWFMGLRRAPILFRAIMTGYLVVVTAFIAIAYLVGLE